MADEVESTPSLTAPAESSAAEASTAAPAATASDASENVSATNEEGMSPAEAQWFAENPDDGSKPVPAQRQQPRKVPVKSGDDADQHSDAGDTLAPPEGETIEGDDGAVTQPVFNADQVNLLKRFKLDPQSKALAAMPTEERAAFVASLENHALYTSQIAQQNAAYRKGAPPQQQQPGQQAAPPTPQPGADDAWKPLQDEYGEAYIKPHRTAVQAEVQQYVGPVQQQAQMQSQMLSDLAQRFIADDIDAAFEKLELPDGVDKSDESVKAKIIEQAWAQFPGFAGFSFSKRSLRSAIQQAATSLYQSKINQAAAAAKAKTNQTRLRGAPDRGASRVPTTRPPLTSEQRENLALEAIDKGMKGDAVEDYVMSGGRR